MERSFRLPFPTGPSAIASSSTHFAASAPNEAAVYIARNLDTEDPSASTALPTEILLRSPYASFRPFTSLMFHGDSLFAASRDAVVTWNVREVFEALSYGEPVPDPTHLCMPPSSVAQLSVSPDGKLLAIAGLELVIALDLGAAPPAIAYQLEGHSGLITAAVFHPTLPRVLVTCGEDRTFRVWDLHAGALSFRSPILCLAPLVALAVDDSSVHPRLAVAAADGVVRIFDFSKPSAVNTCLHTLDLAKLADKLAAAAEPAAPSPRASLQPPIKLIVDPLRRLTLNEGSGDGGGGGGGTRPKWDASTVAAPSSLQDLRSLSSPHGSGGGGGTGSNMSFAHWNNMGNGGGGSPGKPGQLLEETSVASVPGLSIVPLALAFAPPLPHAPSPGTPPSPGPAIFKAAPQLLILLPSVLVSLDGRTYDPRPLRMYPEALLRTGCVASSADSQRVAVLVAGSFSPVVQRILWAPPPLSAASATDGPRGPLRIIDGRSGEMADPAAAAAAAAAAAPSPSASHPSPSGPPLSIFQRTQLPESSPLARALAKPSSSNQASAAASSSSGSCANAELHRARSVNASRYGAAPTAASSSSAATPSAPPAKMRPLGPSVSSKSLGVVDKPVVFHARIKSSGYGSIAGPARLGQPLPPARTVSTSLASKGNANAKALVKSYPMDAAPPVDLQLKHTLPDKRAWHSGAILGLAYSSDGARLLTWSADRTARTWRLPISRFAGEGSDLLGHASAVSGAAFGHSNGLLVTSSFDRTARVWAQGRADPLLFINHTRRSPRVGDAEANPAFTSEVIGARFIYLDQFIALAHQSRLHVYKFNISLLEESRNDLERLKKNNRYKEVTSLRSDAAQSLTAIAAANSFLSPIILAAGSNRSIEIFDLASDSIARTIPEAHERPAHFIALHEPSPFANHSQDAFEIFGTSSADNSIRLWDLRDSRCVSKLAGGHSCRQTPSSFAFSPCLRYVATGSEDKSLVLYDLRTNAVLTKVRGLHQDAVTAVAFHPMYPQLATASVDGRVRFFAGGAEGAQETPE